MVRKSDLVDNSKVLKNHDDLGIDPSAEDTNLYEFIENREMFS